MVTTLIAVLVLSNIVIAESSTLQDISLLHKKQDDTLEQVRKELSKQVRKRRASGSELFLQKSEALEFLQPRHRQKRSLSEECDEGCDFEEVEEVVESKSRVRAYMFEYNCERQSCPAGCYDNNGDYSHNHNLDIQCNPSCDSKGNPEACDIHYSDDVQITRKGNFRDGIGYCGQTDVCSQCNDGFYGGDKYCYICGKIDNCLHRKCSDNNQNLICGWCDGEIAARQYWKAYTGDVDGRKSCQQACSWRADSTRCYPGTCADELSANCQCAANFEGTHCEKIAESPPILENHGIFYDDLQRKIRKIENDPNHVTDGHPIVWSNFVFFGVAQTKMSAKYLQPNVGLDADHYVRNFKVGLIEMKTTISLYRGGSLKSTKVQTCGTMNKYEPIDHLTCTQEFYLSTFTGPNWLPLQHDDKIIYKVSATNGGFVTIQNRDEFPREVYKTFFYEGQETTREFEYHWDLVTPYHCSKTQGASCTPFIFIQQDVTDNPTITFTWGGWSDDLSGMSHFKYEVFDLVATADGLKDGFDIKETNTLPNGSSSFSITVTQPSMYSIHISAFDVAGNHKTGRGIFFFDDQSQVTIHGDPVKCTTASKDTDYVWVIEDVSTVEMIWPDRFQNTRHKSNRWLNPVLNLAAGTDPIYEDLYGNRTNEKVPHIHGIVEFKTAFDVMDPNPKDSQSFTALPSEKLTDQSTSLTLNWADGDRLNFTIQAYDILGVYAEETLNIYRDASPAIIEDLWLTRGDRLNVSVHRLEDFNKMTIEWVAYDYHSGLETVYWKLYDNYQTYVQHGYEDIVAQGNAADLPECNMKYGSSPRGANCYCTPFMGCFHQHFQVKPEIKAHGGLVLGKDRGVHDSDYYIEVAVKNKALVQTVLTKKITVDISPPHAGVVHDGLPGNPEVDYQQGLDLKAYWDQFFDRESGVFFYQYYVNTSCADKSVFGLDLANDTKVVETYNTFGTETAPGDGTYYFTVVAYNRALDPSEPVCSDGVTIDSTVPGVKEVVISDAIITGGLVTDVNQSDFYILDSDRYRRTIKDSTPDCLTKATVLDNLDLFPIKRFENGTAITVDGADFCTNSTGSRSSIGLVLSKSSLMEISWMPIDIPGNVFDYEVGLSSTTGSSAPDLMAFESSKQHAHHRIMHTNIPDATEFYIIIKSISKSNVEGITSIGPCFMDTTPPDFTGTISVSLESGFLVASWSANSFVDTEELFDMNYEFAVGHSEYTTDVQTFKPVQSGASCTIATPPLCTAVNITELDWFLHGHHTYYMTVKVRNTAGLVKIQTSDPYIHDVQKPAEGIVLDIDTQDIEDKDFQTETTSMSARWSGFAHPHLDVTYKISIGTTSGGSDVVAPKDVGSVLMHQETSLTLTPYQKYYFTVTAVSVAGTTTSTSDGVTIVTESDTLSGVMIYDGIPCNMTTIGVDHHEEDNRMDCSQEVDVQMSLNSLKAYWTVPDDMKRYTTDAFIAVEKRSGVGNMWTTYQDYFHISTMFDVSIDDLTLSPGIKYRISLKLCAKTICFDPIKTNGVMVMANPPVSGSISINHLNTTETGGAEKLVVSFTKFYDPDIEDVTEKNDAILKYEWAITDNSVVGQTYTTWTNLVTFTTNGDQINFELTLTGEMDFSRCKRFSIRGLNLVRLTSVVSTEILDCDAFNPILINPNIVIDAVGEVTAQDGVGLPVYLEENARWPTPDKDYTPYKNIISAVWPSLRHGNYKYAIIDAKNVDVTTYYKQVNQLNLKDPCIPDAIRCGTTVREFMNEKFEHNELIHGTRYTVCVHADRALIQNEKWLQDLPEINACSDGIIVDLTPPKAGSLWVGHNPGQFYQTSNTDMFINWYGFEDVEEFNNGPHPSGIKAYTVGIGTSSGGNDVVAFEDVGVIQHKSLHRLNLQNGYKYYATLKATDFAGRVTEVVSEPIIVDYTPPATTNKPIVLPNRHITSTTEIDPCWKGVFIDLESGIDYYLWSIGSEPGYVDMMPYVKVEEDECGLTDRNSPLSLKNGHYYYINVRAFNKAGLSTLATSWAFRVDTTPPTAGHVYDGEKSQMVGNIKDIDFQTETKVLHSYWEGFHDSHSTIKEYYVAVGTCPGCGDVLMEQAIGITNEFTLNNIHLGTGLTYYAAVTACNTAGMCTTVVSDGVIIDNSAPVAGSVQDGTGFYDTEYQSITSYISAKWYGFDDPQSGLSHYVWMAGTSKGGSDLVPETELHLTETASFYNTSLSLPQGKRIFVTVRAYNKAGLHSESSSNGFLIDTSPPVISKVPTFSTDFGINGLKQIYRTSMKVEWVSEDTDSYIKRQYLSIKSHIGGEFMLSSQQVNGIARSYVFTGLDLHDGVTYYVTLISCNSAEICVMSTSQGMFVDSSPPSRGMFAIKTDHAADPELLRHSEGWMVWSRQAVHLAWLGFSDLHSGIDHYKVAVGSTYLNNDLNQDTDEKYEHTDTHTDHGDEGKVQLFSVKTETLTSYDTLYISVWAVNTAGVRSALIHSAFTKVPGGPLQLIRRCDSMSCDGHCVCAPQDQKCPINPNLGACSDISANNNNNLLLVRDTNGYNDKDQAVTASDNVLRGQWIVSQVQGLKPLWFEWSVGYNKLSYPSGIYNSAEEKVWQDSGRLMDCIFAAKPGFHLENTISYAVFVRIWYSPNQYAVFKSNGIVVMGQAPVLATVRGRAVTEIVRGTFVKDIDYMQIGRPITYSWHGKFLQADETIEKYSIYLSTSPGGYDILPVTEDLGGSVTSYNMSGIKLTPGVIHYTNVIAYNYAGAHTTATSDGFVIDSTYPNPGIVHDGLGLKDLEFTNISNAVAAHWHGFTDTESGIEFFFWCVGTTTFTDNRRPEKSECSILPWKNVGLHVSASSNVSSDISQGTKVYHKVYAIDNAGKRSTIVVSDGVTVDQTPPMSEKFIHTMENMVSNGSFEVTGGDNIHWRNVSDIDICSVTTSYHPSSWLSDPSTCMAVVTSDVNLAREGQSFLFIRGSIHQELDNVKAGHLYRVTFYSSHLPIPDATSANKEGFVQMGDGEKIIFLIYTKSYRFDGHGVQNGREEVSWHAHTFYIRPDQDGVNITIGSAGSTTGLLLDNLSVQEVNFTRDVATGHVLGHVVYLHEWSSIHGSWSFTEPDSSIIDYSWAIGYSAGGTQIQPFRSVGLANFAFNNNVTLVHNTFIYVTAIATSAAGLSGISYSDPILVDLTPPDIKFINDGRGGDEDAWIFNEVVANWAVEDLESGIKFCKWAIGYTPGTTELLPYTEVTTNSAYKDYDYSLLEGYTVYTTLVCENNGGLSFSKSTDGVKISSTPPSTANVQVEVVSLSATEYNTVNSYQGVTDNMRVKWSGFADHIGIETYQVKFPNDRSETMFFPDNQEILYTHFTKMSLSDQVHDISVRAMNKLFLKSTDVETNITVTTSAPVVDASKDLALSYSSDQVVVSWDRLFTAVFPLYYEVSAGTYSSGVNIIQWQYTNQTSITFGIPKSVKAESGMDVFVTIKAVSVSGLTGLKTGKFKLP